jgi:hypothetical protein
MAFGSAFTVSKPSRGCSAVANSAIANNTMDRGRCDDFKHQR